MLDIVPKCNSVQYQGKLMMQTWENVKNPNFRPNFGRQKFFLVSFTSTDKIVPSYHNIQFKRKLMNQTSENDEKSNFGPNIGPLGPNVVLQFFCKFFLY